MRYVLKVTRLMSNNLFNSKQQTTWFPFWSNLLKANTLSHLSLPSLYALLEEFFWDALQLCCYNPLECLKTFKPSFLMIPLSLVEKKVIGSKIRWKREVVLVLFSQEMLAVQYTQFYYFSNTPKSSVIIFFMSSWFTIIQTVTQRSPHTTCLTCSTLTSVLFVEGLLLFFLFALLVSFKNMYTPPWGYLHTLVEAFQILVTEFVTTVTSNNNNNNNNQVVVVTLNYFIQYQV